MQTRADHLRNWIAGLPVLLAAASASAAEAGGPDAAKQSMTLGEIIQAGGWLMYVLGALSVVALAFIVYFVIVLRQERVVPRALARELQDMLSAGRLDEARSACDRSGAALAAVAAVAVNYVRRVERPDPALLKEIMEGEGSRQAGMIQNQTQYLLDIAVIAPMIGLLGTVVGMLKAFNAVALDIAKAKPMVLAAGVSQALITTVAGLLVAIPAMAFYSYFRGRMSKLVASLEIASMELLAVLEGKGGGPSA